MNDNVGDMPLDIFCDYVSDCLGEEWFLGHFLCMLDFHHEVLINFSGHNMVGQGLGNGHRYGYVNRFEWTFGTGYGNIDSGAKLGCGFYDYGSWGSGTPLINPSTRTLGSGNSPS